MRVVGAVPARWGGGEGACTLPGRRGGAGLQAWGARAHSHGHVPRRVGRSEREGQARGSSATEPSPPPAPVRVRGAAAEVRAGPEARPSFPSGCGPGFSSSPSRLGPAARAALCPGSGPQPARPGSRGPKATVRRS